MREVSVFPIMEYVRNIIKDCFKCFGLCQREWETLLRSFILLNQESGWCEVQRRQIIPGFAKWFKHHCGLIAQIVAQVEICLHYASHMHTHTHTCAHDTCMHASACTCTHRPFFLPREG